MKGRLTKNFKVEEFTCSHCGELVIDEQFIPHIQRLQSFRTWYKRPIYINSAYRCITFNNSLSNASKNSLHLRGLAVDFNLPNEFYKFTKERKEEFIANVVNKWRELEGSQVSIYDTFIHLGSENNYNFKVYDFRKDKNYKIKD